MNEWKGKIKAILEYFGCSKSELEFKTGVKNGYIRDIETGKNKNPSKFIKGLIDNYGINPNWLIGDDDNMLISQDQSFLENPFLREFNNAINQQTAPKFSEQDTRLIYIEELLQKHDEALKQIQRSRFANQIRLEALEDQLPVTAKQKAAISAVMPPAQDDYIEEEYIDLSLAVNLAAGVPIEAADTGDTYPVPLRLIPKKKNARYCVAKIKGDSMTDIGIEDGCYVLLEHTDLPENGENMVVTYGENTTLKLLHRKDDGEWELLFRDGSGAKIELKKGDWAVKGKFICVLPKKP